MSKTEHKKNEQDFREIAAVRCLLREKNYLTNPMLADKHQGLSGIILDDDLQEFTNQARELEKAIIQGDDETSIKNIFVTDIERAEFDKTINLTINVIEENIENMIKKFPVNDQTMLHDVFIKTIKNKTKKFYVSFHDDIKQKLCSI